MLPWLGRSPRRPVEPFASPRKPSTDASVSRCRPRDRLSSAAVLNARLPRTVPSARRESQVSLRPGGSFPHAAHHRCRFPEPKRLPPMSPSAPTCADASPSRVPRACRAPGLTSACARELSDHSHYLRITCDPKRGAAAGAAGPKDPGPASDMLSRAGSRLLARPAVPCRLFTGASEPHAAHRLLQSCSPTSTRLRTSKPGRTVLAKRPPTGSPSLGREEPADLCRHQGSPGDESPYRRPHSDRSPYGFTPARPRVGHPRVAMRTPAVTGKNHRRLPAVEVPPFREDPRALAAPGRGLATTDGRGLPLGPLPFVPREWREGRLHPGCLPPIPSSRRCAWGASWGEGRRLGRRVSPVRRSLARATPFLPERPGT